MSKRTTVILLVAVLLFAVLATAMASENKRHCEMCQKFCHHLKNEQHREKCLARCEKLCSRRSIFPVRRLEVEEDEIEASSANFFRKNKCTLCKAGCALVGPTKASLCLLACSKTACKNKSLDDSEEELETALPVAFGEKKKKRENKWRRKHRRFPRRINKCRLCKKFCKRVTDEDKQAKCYAVCDKLCEKRKRIAEDAEDEIESDFRIRSRRLKRLARVAGKVYRGYRAVKGAGLLEDAPVVAFGEKRKNNKKRFHRRKCLVCFKGCSKLTGDKKFACFGKCKSVCAKKDKRRPRRDRRHKRKRPVEEEEEDVLAENSWQCPACRAACQFIKDQHKRDLCLRACDATVCK